jgi:hypothetical protein
VLLVLKRGSFLGKVARMNPQIPSFKPAFIDRQLCAPFLMILKHPSEQCKNVPLSAGPKGEGCGLQRVLVLRGLFLELGSEGLMLTPTPPEFACSA